LCRRLKVALKKNLILYSISLAFSIIVVLLSWFIVEKFNLSDTSLLFFAPLAAIIISSVFFIKKAEGAKAKIILILTNPTICYFVLITYIVIKLIAMPFRDYD
jgi:hypothetical protein